MSRPKVSQTIQMDREVARQSEENNAREVTADFAARLSDLANAEPIYRNLHQVYST